MSRNEINLKMRLFDNGLIGDDKNNKKRLVI